MNNVLRTTLIVLGIVVLGAALLVIGVTIGRATWGLAGAWPGSMMGFYGGQVDPEDATFGYPYAGMMGGGMMGQGMRGSFAFGQFSGSEPISMEDSERALEDYLTALNDDNLALGEIMIFDNHTYAQIIELDTGIGAQEVLVDPVTLSVYPEYGPNMMWNLKYGMMGGSYNYGMMGGMMGRIGTFTQAEASAEMPVGPEEAVEAAQSYLDIYLSGTQADEHADPFYGYYTLHILRDDETIGMLSVNGYTGQVFVHTWHGDLLEMSGE